MWPFNGKKDNVRKAEEAERQARSATLRRQVLSVAASLTLVFGVFVGVYKICCISDSFGLAKFILVNPSENVTTAHIKRFLDLYPGQNIFSVDLGEMRTVLLNHHWIADVRVTRVPPETIQLFVIERIPVAILTMTEAPDHRLSYYVDKTGTPFSPVPEDNALELPEISGFTMAGFLNESGQTKNLSGKLLEAVHLIETARDKAGILSDRVHRIHFDAAKGYSIFIDSDNKQVLMGPPPYGESLRRLTRIMAGLGEKRDQIEAIDLRESEFTVVTGLHEEDQI